MWPLRHTGYQTTIMQHFLSTKNLSLTTVKKSSCFTESRTFMIQYIKRCSLTTWQEIASIFIPIHSDRWASPCRPRRRTVWAWNPLAMVAQRMRPVRHLAFRQTTFFKRLRRLFKETDKDLEISARKDTFLGSCQFLKDVSFSAFGMNMLAQKWISFLWCSQIFSCEFAGFLPPFAPLG